MSGELGAAIQGMKVLYEIIKANKGLINYNELVSAVAEVNGKLIEAQTATFASHEKQTFLAERVRELEKKIMEIENRESELQKYEPHEFPSGTRALALKPEMQQTEPLHYLCEPCASKGQIFRMQPDGFHDGKGLFLRCHSCNHLIPITAMSPALERAHKARMKA